jgi:hypothetical protein
MILAQYLRSTLLESIHPNSLDINLLVIAILFMLIHHLLAVSLQGLAIHPKKFQQIVILEHQDEYIDEDGVLKLQHVE